MKIPFFKIFTVLIFFSLWGCDNSLEPFEDRRGNYSVYGSLDVNKDINYIRIKDLSLPIDDVPETIDVAVQLRNTATGETEILRDTLVTFEGVNTHNFISTMDIEAETTYRLIVTDSNGESFSVSTTTPKISDREVSVSENFVSPCNSNITTRFSPHDLDLPIKAQLGLEKDYEIHWFNLEFPQVRTFEQEFVINFVIRDMIVFFLLGGAEVANVCSVISSSTIYLRYTHFGPEYLSNAASDSLNANGNVGNFIGLYTDSYAVEVPVLEEVINQ